MITTYGMIAKRKDPKYRSKLWEFEWERIIFDEAHHLPDKSRNHLSLQISMLNERQRISQVDKFFVLRIQFHSHFSSAEFAPGILADAFV